jgi:hypothetical protein
MTCRFKVSAKKPGKLTPAKRANMKKRKLGADGNET